MRNLDELINEASQKARFLGHKLDVFDRHGSKEAYSSCLLCNGVIGVAVQPHEYGEDILGDLLDQHCKGKRKVPRAAPVSAEGLDGAELDVMSLLHNPRRLTELLGTGRPSVSFKKLSTKVLRFPTSKKSPRITPEGIVAVKQPQPVLGVEYTNRKGKTYYLHVGTTKRGNPRYHFSTTASDDLAKSIPEGYEIFENPNAQVFLRKIHPKEILDDEMAILEKELREHAKPTKYIINTRGKVITIFWTNQSGPKTEAELSSFFGMARIEEFYERNAHFSPIFRFTLVDTQDRLFIAERFCFRGSIDDWMHLAGGGPDSLETLATRYVQHLVKDSFYELI
jgi:hypothetical protein